MGQDIKDAVPQVVLVVISSGIYDKDCQRNLKVNGKRAGITLYSWQLQLVEAFDRVCEI